MQTKTSESNKSLKRLSMLSFIIDLPNLCTLCALLSAFLGIYFAIQGVIYFAVIGILWAVLFDWLDGLVASKMKNRTDSQRAFGVQLDSLADVVSFGVLPAMVLLNYTNYNWWFVPVAFITVAACVFRLAYYNIYGLTASKKYTGLPADHNGLIFSVVFLFETLYVGDYFSVILSVVLLIVAFLNLSSLLISKLSKKWICAIAVYVVSMTVYFFNI